MKRGMKGILMAAFFVLGLCVSTGNSILPVHGAEQLKEIKVSEEIQLDEELPESEELFAGYVEKVFYEDLYEESAAYGNVGEYRLKDTEKAFYKEVKNLIKQIAAGDRTDTRQVLNLKLEWSAKELGTSAVTGSNCMQLAKKKLNEVLDLSKVMSYLLMDCPYELFWYDKTQGISLQYMVYYDSNSIIIADLMISMCVAKEYRASENLYIYDSGLTHIIQQAKNRAVEIVNANQEKTRYEKLSAYKDEICALTSYNYDAAESVYTPYGNPWQLIWVFDGNPSTNVVCEGYSKAFQYLCDLSGLNCYTVYGDMSNGTGGGAHMWNIVNFNNKNYLVDLTNCDEGTVGYPDDLFMAGTDQGNVRNGYRFPNCSNICFTYDEELMGLLGEDVLALSQTDFDPTLFENVFSDVFTYDWFYAYVKYVYESGLMSGYKEAFTPNQNLTKAQVAQVLYNMEGQPEIIDRSACTDLIDVYQDWFTDAVCWAYSHGIVTGDLYTKEFSPNAYVTREQLALMLFRYGVYKGYDVSAKGDLSNLKNAWKLSTYAQEAVEWAVGTKMIGGIEIKGADGTIKERDLAPQGTATRAQMATILARFCETY